MKKLINLVYGKFIDFFMKTIICLSGSIVINAKSFRAKMMLH